MKTILGLAGAVAAAICAHVIVASASTVTVTSPPGAVQASATGLPVTNTVTDGFRVGTATPLNGQVTDFNGGGGAVNNGGPTWVASADWTNPSADYAIRNTGTGVSIARFAWLTRSSTMRVTLSSYNTSVQAGVVLGADAAGTSGIAAVLSYSGTVYQMRLVVISSSTPSPCSAVISLTASSTNRTISLTYDPDAGTASATITGGGSPATSTCSLAGVTGANAGLYSNAVSPARYDNINAAL